MDDEWERLIHAQAIQGKVYAHCTGVIPCLYPSESGDLLRIVEIADCPEMHLLFATTSFGGATPVLPQKEVVRGGIPSVVATLGLRYEAHKANRSRFAIEASYGHLFWRPDNSGGRAHHIHSPYYLAEVSFPVWSRRRSPVTRVLYRTDTLMGGSYVNVYQQYSMLLEMPRVLEVHLLVRHKGGFLSAPSVGGLFYDPSIAVGLRLQKELNTVLRYEIRKVADPDGAREEFVKDRYEIYAAWLAVRSHLVYPTIGALVGGELVFPFSKSGVRMGVEIEVGYAASYERVEPYLPSETGGGSGYGSAMVYFGYSAVRRPPATYSQRWHMSGPDIRPPPG